MHLRSKLINAQFFLPLFLLLLFGCDNQQNQHKKGPGHSQKGRANPPSSALEFFQNIYGQGNAPLDSNLVSYLETVGNNHRLAKETQQQLNAAARAEVLRGFLYDSLGLQFDANADHIGSVRPSYVFRSKTSTCVGTVAMAYLLAEKLGIQITHVPIRNHVFLRIHDDSSYVNFEPNRNGYQYSDQEYLTKYGFTTSDSAVLKDRHWEAFSVVYFYTVGNTFRNKFKHGQAISYYEKALAQDPNYLPAKGNLALSMDFKGKSKEAVPLLQEIWRLEPGIQSGYNLAVVALKTQNDSLANAVFHSLWNAEDDVLKNKARADQRMLSLQSALYRLNP